MELTFLGTGSAYPHTNRSASCIIFRHVASECWMFDCGEGSQIQIRKDKSIKVGRVTKIFITHLHGDHLFGLPGFIDTYQDNFKANDENRILEIYGPEGLRKYVRTCLELSRSDLRIPYIVHELIPEPEQYHSHWKLWPVDHTSNDQFHPKEDKEGTSIHAKNGVWHLFTDERYTVTASWLKHRIPCFGFCIQEHEQPGKLDPSLLKARGVKPGPLYAKVKKGETIETPSGEKIEPSEVLGPGRPGCKVVILGDTCDSSQMEPLCEGADVIVHESTLENEMEENCRDKGHSTPEMAGKFAKKVNAKMLIITHFSQRYKPAHKECKENETSALKLLKQAKEAFDSDNVVAAEDLLTVVIPMPSVPSPSNKKPRLEMEIS